VGAFASCLMGWFLGDQPPTYQGGVGAARRLLLLLHLCLLLEQLLLL
jgi:hypothetical protein